MQLYIHIYIFLKKADLIFQTKSIQNNHSGVLPIYAGRWHNVFLHIRMELHLRLFEYE